MESTLDDRIFRYLVKFAIVENYFKRVRPLTKWYSDNSENHNIIAPLILRDVPRVYKNIKQDQQLQPIDEHLREKLIAEAHLDGAYVIQGRQISKKVIIHGLISHALNELKLDSVDKMVKTYLPADFMKQDNAGSPVELVGSKTLNALAAGLAGGRGYAIKQTVVNSIGMGKVVMFDEDGLKAEFYLEHGRNLNPGEYIDPVMKVVGVLKVHNVKKQICTSAIISPKTLGLNVSKYMNMGDKFVKVMNALLDA